MIQSILRLFVILTIYSVCPLISLAQNTDKAKYECLYRFRVLTDTTQSEVAVDDLMLLRLNDKQSVFYSEATHRIDSLLEAGKSQELMNDFVSNGSAKYGKRGVEYSVRKDFDGGSLAHLHNLGGIKYYYEEAIPEFNWKITNETKKIWDYTCQKAVCNFRGRRYEAWFTNEIPIKDGPWKFCGLPGLILSVADTAGHYSFDFVGFHTSEATIKLLGNNYTKVSREEYLKTYKRYIKDPVAFMQALSGIKVQLTPAQQARRKEQLKEIKFSPMERDF